MNQQYQLTPLFLAVNQDGFSQLMQERLAHQSADFFEIDIQVKHIINAVIADGDDAVLKYTKQFDQLDANSVAALEVSKTQMQQAIHNIDPSLYDALLKSAERIQIFHEKQIQRDWQYEDEYGNMLGQKVTAIDRVGVYVPGGKAAYPSSVLMNVIPAKIAGVSEVIMAVPAPKGQLNDVVLAAAAIADVDQIFTIGGAQAVAALAYGTKTISSVDKIVGPGNAYVAAAKKAVFGKVGIDMVAGPSEILIISDASMDPEWIAMDLFSQAEHDELAQVILISPDESHLQQVIVAMNAMLDSMPRSAIIRESVNNRGLFIHANDMSQAIELANQVAPEHLELAVENPMDYLEKIRHAGAIFIGRFTPEAIGDYCAGPNHVLPTSGNAKFSSSLGVSDFQKRSSLIYCSEQGVKPLAKIASTVATHEGLSAHARSADLRKGD